MLQTIEPAEGERSSHNKELVQQVAIADAKPAVTYLSIAALMGAMLILSIVFALLTISAARTTENSAISEPPSLSTEEPPLDGYPGVAGRRTTSLRLRTYDRGTASGRPVSSSVPF